MSGTREKKGLTGRTLNPTLRGCRNRKPQHTRAHVFVLMLAVAGCMGMITHIAVENIFTGWG